MHEVGRLRELDVTGDGAPASRGLRIVLAWLKRSNSRSSGSRLLEKTLLCRAILCWQYSAQTGSLMSHVCFSLGSGVTDFGVWLSLSWPLATHLRSPVEPQNSEEALFSEVEEALVLDH